MRRKGKNGTQIERAIEIIIKEEYISWSFISRRLQVGYLGAQEVIKKLEGMGYIEKGDSNKMKVIKHKFLN